MGYTNRTGRPPLAPRRYYLHVALASDTYDEAFAVSRELRVSVPEVVRRALRQLLDERSTDTLQPK